MFVLACLLNKDGVIIAFPVLGEHFLTKVLKDGVLAVLLGLGVVGISYVLTRRVNVFEELSQTLAQLMGRLDLQDIVFLAFFSSIGEEFLFRGIVQHHAGLVLTSVAFGLLHTAPGKQGYVWSIFALVMGFVLGQQYIWTQNILAPICTHFVINACNLYLIQRSLAKTQ